MKKLIAILAMVAVLSPPFIAQAGQEIVPNGVQRIGAAGEGLDYEAVGVAVIDTGIDLKIPDLNVVGGVDCTNATGSYMAERAVVPGGQRSIWEPDPDEKKRQADAAARAATSSNAITSTPAKPDIPVIGADGIFSLYGYEFKIQTVGDNPSALGGSNPDAVGYEDGNGHGTHVAGIIGARQDGQGLIGVAPNARLYAVRVLDGSGGGSLDNVVCGLDWVAANAAAENISVVNMSLGMNTGQKIMDMIEPCDFEESKADFVVKTGLMKDEFHESICDVVDAGVTVVVAAGNGWGDSATTIPAAYPEVITVSNFFDNDGLPGGLGGNETACPQMGGNDDQLWSHLNGSPSFGYGSYGGEAVDISAPGTCVLSTFPGGMQALTGTSMASPHVAGAVARVIGDDLTVLTEDDPETAVNEFAAEPQTLINVTMARGALMDIAEPQTELFRDNDEWHEPIVHVEAPPAATTAPAPTEYQWGDWTFSFDDDD